MNRMISQGLGAVSAISPFDRKRCFYFRARLNAACVTAAAAAGSEGLTCKRMSGFLLNVSDYTRRGRIRLHQSNTSVSVVEEEEEFYFLLPSE